jgi:hypothetical protein
MDSHLDASTEDYEAKTKEFESVSHRVFGAMHSSGEQSSGMPGMGGTNMPNMSGMPGMDGGMPDMSKIDEMLKNLTPEQRAQFEELAKQQMGNGMNMGGMGGFDPSEQSSSGSDHNGTKIEEVD